MEKLELERLFEAIRKDDLKSFSSVMLSKSDLNISFGRFPILSLLYLYGSYKILEKYERFLLPIHNFQVVEENYDAYLKFKKYAKKSLKIFVLNDKIIHPIEMLAVLDERFLLNKYYKKLFKNEEIVKNIRKIYILNQKIDIEISHEDIVIPKAKLNFVQKMAMVLAVCVMSLVIAFSAVAIVTIKNKSGIGTAAAPIKISTEQELQTAIKKGNKHYALTNNIVLSQVFEASNFSGCLDGNGFEIDGGVFMSNGLVENLTGTIEDLKVSAEIKGKNISQNYSIIAKKSSGNVKNVNVFAEIDWQAHNDTDIYLAGVVAHNTGIVENVNVEIFGKINNNRSSNVFFAGVVGLNDGTVKNCVTETARVEADTIDIGGIVAQNNNLIENCENDLTLVQVSEKEWHPNTAGICITNYGKISGCKNKAEVYAESKVATKKDDSSYAVIVGGIVCDNYGGVYESRNVGSVVAKGDVSMCYAGGIVARNILTDVRAIVEKCKAENEDNVIFAYSKSDLVCVGGIAGHNSSEIVNCGFVGTIDADTDSTGTGVLAYVGGVVGYNAECKIEKCYSKVKFTQSFTDSDTRKYFVGAVAGYVGTVQYVSIDGVYSYTPYGLKHIADNYYVVDASFKYVAMGVKTYVYFNTPTSSEYVQVVDAEKFTPHTSLDDFLTQGEEFVDD